MYCIYKLTNKINGKSYIGQTCNFKKRMQGHKDRINNEDFLVYELYQDIKKIGFDNFSKEIIEDNLTKEEAENEERYYIGKYDTYENGYNNTKGGTGDFLTDEMKKKISGTVKEHWDNGVYETRKTNIKKALEVAHKTSSERATKMWQNQETRDTIRKKISEKHSRPIIAYTKEIELYFDTYNDAISFLKEQGWEKASKSAITYGKKHGTKRYGYYWKV